jgi:bifunctional NMN adenylyltransferase/nudix hydrolase
MQERVKPEYERLKGELEFLQRYQKDTQNQPYPVQFITADAVVTQGGHVLMIRRKNHPGKGLWALPGGYVQYNETIRTGLVRELLEETEIVAPRETIEASITESRVFDHPQRDLRGRIVTHAFRIQLPERDTLPTTRGSDDAAEAKWISYGDLPDYESKTYADHYHIIQAMLMR